MLSVKNCRDLLGNESVDLSDSDVESLRNQFYWLGSVIVSRFQSDPALRSGARAYFRTALEMFTETEKTAIEERAAVIEFDGQLPREQAERIAIAQAMKDWNN